MVEVTNAGPTDDPGPITLTDVLPVACVTWTRPAPADVHRGRCRDLHAGGRAGHGRLDNGAGARRRTPCCVSVGGQHRFGRNSRRGLRLDEQHVHRHRHGCAAGRPRPHQGSRSGRRPRHMDDPGRQPRSRRGHPAVHGGRQLPAGLVYIAERGPGWTCAQRGHASPARTASVAVGDSTTLTVVTRVTAAAGSEAEQAVVASAQDADPTDNSVPPCSPSPPTSRPVRGRRQPAAAHGCRRDPAAGAQPPADARGRRGSADGRRRET